MGKTCGFTDEPDPRKGLDACIYKYEFVILTQIILILKFDYRYTIILYSEKCIVVSYNS